VKGLGIGGDWRKDGDVSGDERIKNYRNRGGGYYD
jgi:hypothetical protein